MAKYKDMEIDLLDFGENDHPHLRVMYKGIAYLIKIPKQKLKRMLNTANRFQVKKLSLTLNLY